MPLDFLRGISSTAKFIKDTAISVSTGVADALKLVGTGANGLIDPSFFPDNIGASTELGTAGEALSPGDYVYIVDVTGTATVFLADSSAEATIATGFVDAAYVASDPVTVLLDQINTDITVAAADVGKPVYLDAAGAITYVAPTLTIGSGAVCQQVGIATTTGIYSNSHAMTTTIVTA